MEDDISDEILQDRIDQLVEALSDEDLSQGDRRWYERQLDKLRREKKRRDGQKQEDDTPQ